MNRQQLIGGVVIAALLAGVWLSSRDPSETAALPEPEAGTLPMAAAEVTTLTAEPSAEPSPTFVVLTFEPQVTDTVEFIPLPPTEALAAVVEAAPAATQPPAVAPTQGLPPPTEAPPPPTAVPPPPAPADPTVTQAEQNLVEHVNYQRAQYGMAAYVRDETLMQIARGRVADMVARNYFSHYDPASGANAAQEQIRAAGFNRGSENIFRSGADLANVPSNAVSWFMSDQIYRDSILSSVYTSVGAGVARQGNAWIVVITFAY